MTHTQRRIAKQYKELDEIMAWVLEAKDKEDLYAAVVSYANKFSEINLDAKRRQIKAWFKYLESTTLDAGILIVSWAEVIKAFKQLKKINQ